MEPLKDLIGRFAQPGQVTWIGLRPARRMEMVPVDVVDAGPLGLAGDHGRPGKRAVTLVQDEHLAVIGAYLGRRAVSAADLRRNLVVSGINLVSLRDRRVQVGEVVLHITGPCAPCSRMEEAFGAGGYAAVRGHGGMTASVVSAGSIALGDQVCPL